MLSDKIKKLRQQKNMTQKELADAIGVGQSTIGMIESGKNKGSNDTILKLAKYFGVSIDYLLSTEEKLDMSINTLNTINKLAKKGLDCNKIDFENGINFISSHFKNEKFTQEEQNEIIDYIKYIISKRK